MKIVLIELVGSHGGTLDFRSVNIPEGRPTTAKINQPRCWSSSSTSC